MEMRSLLWRRLDVIVDGREIDCFFFGGIGGERSGESEIDGRAIRSVESGRGRDTENRSWRGDGGWGLERWWGLEGW